MSWVGWVVLATCAAIIWCGNNVPALEDPDRNAGTAAFAFLYLAAVVVGGLALLAMVLGGLSGPTGGESDCYNAKCY